MGNVKNETLWEKNLRQRSLTHKSAGERGNNKPETIMPPLTPRRRYLS